MKIITFLISIFFLFGCTKNTGYLPDICFEQDRISYRAELEELCPQPKNVLDAVRQVQDIAELKELNLFFNYDAAYYETKYWETSSGLKYVGTVDFRLKDIYIANYVVDGTDYRDSVLRHEFFHVALLKLTGDPDYSHTDSRWNNGINSIICQDGLLLIKE